MTEEFVEVAETLEDMELPEVLPSYRTESDHNWTYRCRVVREERRFLPDRWRLIVEYEVTYYDGSSAWHRNGDKDLGFKTEEEALYAGKEWLDNLRDRGLGLAPGKFVT